MRALVWGAMGCAACSFHPLAAKGGGPPVVADAAASEPHVDAPNAPPIDAKVAPTPDAAPDAAPDAPPRSWVVIDTVTVSCSGATASSAVTLATGVMYELHATGTCVTNTGNDSQSDAEYVGFNLVNPPYDTYGGVDYGISVNGTTVGPTKQPHWGTYTATHDYSVTWTGGGAPISLTFFDSGYANNATGGSLTVQILAYQ